MEVFKDVEQYITIYHKNGNNWERYHKNASLRNVSYYNRNMTGSNSTDNALIRIFEVEGYNHTWTCKKGDIICSKKINDIIEKAPLTELREKYGKENVFEVSSVEEFIFDDARIKKLNHIKIGGR